MEKSIQNNTHLWDYCTGETINLDQFFYFPTSSLMLSWESIVAISLKFPGSLLELKHFDSKQCFSKPLFYIQKKRQEQFLFLKKKFAGYCNSNQKLL